jgi:hypothetical protein
MPNEVGIEKTKEFLKALEVVVPKIVGRLKDGAGADDLIALAADSDFRAAVVAAVAAAKSVPAEGKDLSLDEGVALIPDVAELVVAIVKAVKA